VLLRRQWWLDTRRIRSRWFRSTGARRLLDVALECDAIGLPRVFFANVYVPPTNEYTALGNDVKPLWVDAANPFCLELVERLLDISNWLVISECLPGPDQLWFRRNEQAHTTEISVEMAL
jgi:hypothetical protein